MCIRDSNKVFAVNFPIITIADMVKAQVRLIDNLGIDKLVSVIGGSMGGMQALEWAASYPERLKSAIPIATPPDILHKILPFMN